MPVYTVVEKDKVQDVANKVFTATRGLDTNMITPRKHASSIAQLLSEVGQNAHTTVVVSETVDVPANIDLTLYRNIHWLFVGSGKLKPASGVNVKLYSPGTIIADPLQEIFDASAGGTFSFTLAGTVHVGWFGAIPDGQTLCAAPINRAIGSLPTNRGGRVQFQGGSYMIEDSIIVNRERLCLVGVGWTSTQLISTCIGKATILFSGELTYNAVEDMELLGNGLSGASGNGHGISLIDPSPDSGAFAPQTCIVRKVKISQFRGNDSNGRGGSMLACAIAQVATLECKIEDCVIESCGNGLYFDSCFTSRIFNSIVNGCQKYGILALGVSRPIESLHLHGNDLINSGDGTTTAQTGWATAPTANFFAYNVQGLSLVGNKAKNGSSANFVTHICNGVGGSGNWVRADNKRGCHFRNTNGVEWIGNYHDQTNGNPNPGEYLLIEMTDGHDCRGYKITGNKFRFQGGINAAYMLKVRGDAGARKLIGADITGNDFGEEGVVGATTISDCILFEQCTLSGVQLNANSIYAETNVTITNAVRFDADVTVDDDCDINDNSFYVNGGTITNRYQWDPAGNGFVQRFRGTGSPEGVVRAYRGSVYQRKDGGAGTCFYVKESAGWGNTGWVGK